ncbi:MAG: hypothetical protein NTX25_19160 [Proteobacteria bacterium]|nr:hypothetical protein [Pseudomonadota bacterium]
MKKLKLYLFHSLTIVVALKSAACQKSKKFSPKQDQSIAGSHVTEKDSGLGANSTGPSQKPTQDEQLADPPENKPKILEKTPPAPPNPVILGQISYTLDPSFARIPEIRLKVSQAMDQALQFYNTHTQLSKKITVSYLASVPTADANFEGHMRFGQDQRYMVPLTAMHETAHTLGIGTHPKWSSLIVDGLWTGENAVATLRSITGDPSAVLHADSQHFWPYGLNYADRESEADFLNHCKIVIALRKDMGL